MHKVKVSGERSARLKKSKKRKEEIHSFFPVDRYRCECQEGIRILRHKLAKMNESSREEFLAKYKTFECPRVKEPNMERYAIKCNSCGKLQGYIHATGPDLKDWCNFHFVQWHYGKYWYGCFTPHISPIDEHLCLECTCGQDTRDFRLNKTMPGSIVKNIEKRNRIGRKWGKKDSKFRLEKING